MHELMIPGAEITGPRLEELELCTSLPMLNQLRGLDRLHIVHGLREDLQGDVVAPGLVLGWLVVLLGEGRDEGLGSGRVDQVMPDQRPGPDEVALAGSPRGRCIEAESSNRQVEHD